MRNTLIQCEQSIFDDRTAGVLCLDCRSQPTDSSRKSLGELCNSHAAVYRSHLDRGRVR